MRLDELEWKPSARPGVQYVYFRVGGVEWHILRWKDGTYSLGPMGKPWTYDKLDPFGAQAVLYHLTASKNADT